MKNLKTYISEKLIINKNYNYNISKNGQKFDEILKIFEQGEEDIVVLNGNGDLYIKDLIDEIFETEFNEDNEWDSKFVNNWVKTMFNTYKKNFPDIISKNDIEKGYYTLDVLYGAEFISEQQYYKMLEILNLIIKQPNTYKYNHYHFHDKIFMNVLYNENEYFILYVIDYDDNNICALAIIKLK